MTQPRPSARSFIGQEVTVHIDRPAGSRHPKWDFVYPLNYGYVPGVFGGDGEELDAYVLGVIAPLTVFTGVCTAVLHRLNDDDDKLILTPAGQTYTDNQIRALVDFQERYFQSEIWRN